jgi:hypothetical protein
MRISATVTHLINGNLPFKRTVTLQREEMMRETRDMEHKIKTIMRGKRILPILTPTSPSEL